MTDEQDERVLVLLERLVKVCERQKKDIDNLQITGAVLLVTFLLVTIIRSFA